MLLFSSFLYFLGLGLGIETAGSTLALARARGAQIKLTRAHQNPTLQAVYNYSITDLSFSFNSLNHNQ